ncbi:hypothetical protein F511_21731 [Dorcoceras hygrometricum]|uniref:Uncharacterized protein n=1 Tax=Dorcoceras hygrometricum TaxID=472368 RepID=A0A2Z7BQP3_9LAMI|nr:hypothetical protein F511_21731 [Dorcoceras hygrometricum]
MCLAWEVLHWQYTQLSQKISSQPESSTTYNHSAQQFQQFQVLLQRFIENEPFEVGLRPEIYFRARKTLPKLLQVPKIQGFDGQNTGEDASDIMILAPDFIRIIESSILSFHQFVKVDKKNSSSSRNLFGTQNQMATPVEHIQSSLEKKAMKLKELRKRSKGYKKKSREHMDMDMDMVLGVVDVKISKFLLILSVAFIFGNFDRSDFDAKLLAVRFCSGVNAGQPYCSSLLMDLESAEVREA